MSAYTDKLCPHILRSGLSALGSGGRSFEGGSHLGFMYLKKKIEQCHKLLLVLGGDLAQTRSYSRRWQVARIGLCGSVRRVYQIENSPLSVHAGDL